MSWSWFELFMSTLTLRYRNSSQSVASFDSNDKISDFESLNQRKKIVTTRWWFLWKRKRFHVFVTERKKCRELRQNFKRSTFFWPDKSILSPSIFWNIFCQEQSPNLVSFDKASLMCISKSVSFASFDLCITVSSLVILSVGNRGCNLNKYLKN